ncbi:MAG: hypothetical protein GXO87_11190 [Chlorobi bacterium]|nr:hypothetical protein [Chlorobiota bacterium]
MSLTRVGNSKNLPTRHGFRQAFDYYGNWKALHYAVKEAFKNVILSVVAGEKDFSVFVISDRLESFPASLRLTAMNFTGDTLNASESTMMVDANAVRKAEKNNIAAFTKGNRLTSLLVKSEIVDTSGKVLDKNIFYFVPQKNLSLPQPDVTCAISKTKEGKTETVLHSTKLAKNVYLFTSIDGRFSDNYFDLLPDEEKTVYFQSNKQVPADSLKNDLQIITLAESYEH